MNPDALLKNVTFRNTDCPGYGKCLAEAAIVDAKRLSCECCQHQGDKSEPQHFDNFDFHETLACCRLLHVVFFEG